MASRFLYHHSATAVTRNSTELTNANITFEICQDGNHQNNTAAFLTLLLSAFNHFCHPAYSLPWEVKCTSICSGVTILCYDIKVVFFADITSPTSKLKF